jgi:hypothetical protein
VKEVVNPEMPASVPYIIMSAFKGSLEEKPPSSLKGIIVRKVSSCAKVGCALALKIIYHVFFSFGLETHHIVAQFIASKKRQLELWKDVGKSFMYKII